MEKGLSEKLVEIIGTIQDSVGQVSDFAVNQLPDIAQQYLAFGRWYGTISFVVLVVLAVAFIWLTRRCADRAADDNLGYIFGTIGSVVGALITGGLALSSIQNLLLVWLAPKIYLIKGLTALIR